MLASTALASPALAQTEEPDLLPPVREAVDANGVNLATGLLERVDPKIMIGTAESGLSFRRRTVDYNYAIYGSAPDTVQVAAGGKSIEFNLVSGVYVNKQGTGETLTVSGSNWTFTGRDGTVVQLGTNQMNQSAATFRYHGSAVLAIGNSVIFPNKEKLTLTYKNLNSTNIDGIVSNARLQSVVSSNGYMAKLEYADNGTTYTTLYNRLTKATLINLAVDYCNPAADSCAGLTTAWPSLTFNLTSASNGTETITDALNQATVFTFASGKLAAVRRASSATDNATIAYGADSRIYQLTIDGRTWTYSWNYASPLMTATIVNPDGSQKVAVTDTTINRLKSMKDELERTTSYTYDTNGRLTLVTYPEGNKSQYSYDGRGNVTEERFISKTPGTPPDMVRSAVYPASCTNLLTCNAPTSRTDARGQTVDFTYDATHGGIKTVTVPAPTTGAVRPKTTFNYTPLQAYYKNSAGSIVASGQATYLRTTVTGCQTLASCAGTADEVVATISYGPQSAGTANNLLPASVARGAGNNPTVSSTGFGYDAVGNVVTVDGPLPGTADTIRTVYDAGRQVRGTISPDPDGGGPLPNRASRLTRNADGQIIKVETGTTAGQSDTDWNNFVPAERVEIVRDSSNRVVQKKLINGPTVYSLTQSSYDSRGRLQCTAQRMNSATYSSLPASACTPATPGAFGPDKIVKISYDLADELTEVRSGVGTDSEAATRTLTYTANGLLQSLTDAENNKSTFEYDGQDRLVKTRYPVLAKGSGSSSATDFELLTYENTQSGTRTSTMVASVQNRAGEITAFTYDNLGRLTLKNLPGTEPDVTYAYDNFGRLTSAAQSGNSVSYTYDAMSRQLTETGAQGSVATDWDAAGRRTRTTYPGGGLYVDYDYLVTGEVSAIRENGATSGIGVLASFAYDALGRRTTLTYGNGVVHSFGYDPVSRLTSLSEDFAGTAYDLGLSFPRDPAGRIASTTRTNDQFAWSGGAVVNRPYTANGLNQYTAAGPASFQYDARGNLTSDGSSTYSYSSEDLLKSATVGGAAASLNYDPLGRLNQVSSAVTTRFAYDGNRMVAEFDGGGAILRRYVHGTGADQPLVQYEGSGTTDRRFLSGDERGSIVAVSNGSGTVTTANNYDDYGIPGPTNYGRFQYTGQAWLPELGLYHYKSRFYSPSLGRFLQTDPSGYGDNSNLYAYVGNDPVNRIDPLGLEDLWVTPQTPPQPPDIVVTGQRPPPQPHEFPSQEIRDFIGDLQRPGGMVGETAANEKNKGKKETKTCENLREAGENARADLPGWVATDDQWNDPNFLRGQLASVLMNQDDAENIAWLFGSVGGTDIKEGAKRAAERGVKGVRAISPWGVASLAYGSYAAHMATEYAKQAAAIRARIAQLEAERDGTCPTANG